jgi:hypothetical protein
MLFSGAAMACFGIFMLSLSKEYYQIILTQGICTGLGCGVLFIPGMALVSRSFNARRAVALGLVSCGAPFGTLQVFVITWGKGLLTDKTGGIIYTVVFEQLIDPLGFAWTVRVMGFIMTGTFLTAFPLLLWGASNTGDISSGTTRKLFDKAALKDTGFWFYTWANFFVRLLVGRLPSLSRSADSHRYSPATLCLSSTSRAMHNFRSAHLALWHSIQL